MRYSIVQVNHQNFISDLVFSSFTFLTVSRIFSPEENVLERTATGLVSFGEGNLEIRLLLITE